MIDTKKGDVMKSVKHYCLVLLTMLPVVAVAFAAQSALNVAQIRNGDVSDETSQADGVRSGLQKGG